MEFDGFGVWWSNGGLFSRKNLLRQEKPATAERIIFGSPKVFLISGFLSVESWPNDFSLVGSALSTLPFTGTSLSDSAGSLDA